MAKYTTEILGSITTRKSDILKALISEYIFGAEPIGSEFLAQKYEFGVKSATIRSELSEMLDLGYLKQPYTSSGRIPSDLGYRYYVNHLLQKKNVSQETKKTLDFLTNEGELLKETLYDVTHEISKYTKLLSVAYVPKNLELNILNIVVSNITSNRALLVVVLSNGHVENRILEFSESLSIQKISLINQVLLDNLRGVKLKKIKQTLTLDIKSNSPTINNYLVLIFNALEQIFNECTEGDIIFNGEEYLFAQPESEKDSEYRDNVLAMLTGKINLSQVFNAKSNESHIIIGNEHSSKNLHHFSFIKSPFYIGTNEAGSLAIIGPTRMSYEFCIPLLEYTAKIVSNQLTRRIGL